MAKNQQMLTSRQCWKSHSLLIIVQNVTATLKAFKFITNVAYSLGKQILGIYPSKLKVFTQKPVCKCLWRIINFFKMKNKIPLIGERCAYSGRYMQWDTTQQ